MRQLDNVRLSGVSVQLSMAFQWTTRCGFGGVSMDGSPRIMAVLIRAVYI